MSYSEDLTKLKVLQKRVADLESRLEALDSVPADVQGLADGLEALGKRFAAAKPAPAWWPDLSDMERTQRWPELIAWVRDVLAPQFSREASRSVTRCWADHPTAVHALTSAWLTWQVTYDRSSEPDAAADWQTRTLPDLLERTRDELSGCRDGCQGPTAPPQLWPD